MISEHCLAEQNRSKLFDVLKKYREEEKIEIREVTGRRLVVGNQLVRFDEDEEECSKIPYI